MVDPGTPPIPVLHIITRLIVGGAQENTIYTAAMLDKTRYETSILCGPQTGSEGSLIDEVKELNIPLTIIPQLVRQISPLKDLLAFIKIYRHIRHHQFTIVHTHSSKAGILGRIAARLARAPIIIHTVHGWSFHDYMHPLLRKTYVALEKFCAKFTEKLIVVSNLDINKGLLAKIGRPDQYLLIRSAIPLEKFQRSPVSSNSLRDELGIPTYVPVIGNIGRFSKQKNPLDWVKIASLLSQHSPNCYFIMVGDGPLHKQVVDLIHSEGIEDRVILTGLRRDVARLLSVMDIFLLTSLWEGLPRVLPQAMMMEIPIVAFRSNGVAEVISHGINGYLCEQRDVNSAANHCLYLLNNQRIRIKLGKNGKSLIKTKFDIKQMILDIDQLYQYLLKEKGL